MPEVANSILQETKKIIGYAPLDESFDTDMIVFINSAFATLEQLGLGAYSIADETATWDLLEASPVLLSAIRMYLYWKVKLAFDPPGTSFGITAIENQIKETEWRIREQIELEGASP